MITHEQGMIIREIVQYCTDAMKTLKGGYEDGIYVQMDDGVEVTSEYCAIVRTTGTRHTEHTTSTWVQNNNYSFVSNDSTRSPNTITTCKDDDYRNSKVSDDPCTGLSFSTEYDESSFMSSLFNLTDEELDACMIRSFIRDFLDEPQQLITLNLEHLMLNGKLNTDMLKDARDYMLYR